jgi:hypothetical protein
MRMMTSLDDFPDVYCPTCRRVQPALFDLVKADAYIDHDSLDIVCKGCRSLIATLHSEKPDHHMPQGKHFETRLGRRKYEELQNQGTRAFYATSTQFWVAIYALKSSSALTL